MEIVFGIIFLVLIYIVLFKRPKANPNNRVSNSTQFALTSSSTFDNQSLATNQFQFSPAEKHVADVSSNIVSLVRQQKFDEALKWICEYGTIFNHLGGNIGKIFCLNLGGLCLARLNKWKEAYSYYQGYLTLVNYDWVAWAFCAMYLETCDLNLALQSYKQALSCGERKNLYAIKNVLIIPNMSEEVKCSILLKISDIYNRLGDLKKGRVYRTKVREQAIEFDLPTSVMLAADECWRKQATLKQGQRVFKQ